MIRDVIVHLFVSRRETRRVAVHVEAAAEDLVGYRRVLLNSVSVLPFLLCFALPLLLRMDFGSDTLSAVNCFVKVKWQIDFVANAV